eukprot:SAG11_NODE_831_length_6955_cov_5.280776_2_plen_703_part_00
MEVHLRKKMGDDFDEEVVDTVFEKLDTDESGMLDILEFAAAADDHAARKFKDIYVEMEKTFQQFETCKAFVFFCSFSFIYFFVVYLQLDINGGYEVEQGLRNALFSMEYGNSNTLDSVRSPHDFWQWTSCVDYASRLALTMLDFVQEIIHSPISHIFCFVSTHATAHAHAHGCSSVLPVGPWSQKCIRKTSTMTSRWSRSRKTYGACSHPICNFPQRHNYLNQLSCHSQFLASYNRVIGGIFLRQSRGIRRNADECDLTYKRFYPVCYSEEPDKQPFGPLYDPALETTFSINEALLVNAGVDAGGSDPTSICRTYDTYFLRESFCAGTCQLTTPIPEMNAYKVNNGQCTTCKYMCLDHLESALHDDLGSVVPERLELLCSACRTFATSTEYTGSRMHFLDDEGGVCDRHKEECLLAMCDKCILADAPLVYSSSLACQATAPMCDYYLHNVTNEICAPRYDLCPPTSVGDMECNPGCDNTLCGYDGGDCCQQHMPLCDAASMLNDTACNDECNNEFCRYDGGDCVFCTGDAVDRCYPQWIGDGQCSPVCYNDACSYDAGDCGSCPAECVATLGDGVCNEECYDLCPEEQSDCPHCDGHDSCPLFYIANGRCDSACYNVECDWDTQGTDSDCYFCGAACVAVMGNGVCNPECCTCAKIMLFSSHYSMFDRVSVLRTMPVDRDHVDQILEPATWTVASECAACYY